MNITLLHLSDLHFIANWPEETGLVCDRLFSDIANQIKELEHPYLLFSGDFVHVGDDLNTYETFSRQFSTFFDTVSIPFSRRISVPGNHDVSQSAVARMVPIHTGALEQMTSERVFNDNLPTLIEKCLDSKFTNYRLFEKSFAHFSCCGNTLGGTGWALTDEVGVYCLNTALCSSGAAKDNNGNKLNDYGKLLVDTRTLHHWITNTSFKSRILAMHHPLEWLAPWAKVELQSIIANSFDLVLSGHIHDSSAIYASQVFVA